MPIGQLTIIGAAYGLIDVSAAVAGLVNSQASPQTLSITPGENVFPTTQPQLSGKKSLTVVYCYDDGAPQTAVAPDGTPLSLAQSAPAPVVPAGSASGPQLSVLGCSYGLSDVTGKVAGMVDPVAQTLNLTADDATFLDSWPGTVKTFVIVSSYSNAPVLTIVAEGGQVKLSPIPNLATAITTDGSSVFWLDTTGQVWGGGDTNWSEVPFLQGIASLSFGPHSSLWSIPIGPYADQPILYTPQVGQAPKPTGACAVQVVAGLDGEAWAITSGNTLLRWNDVGAAWEAQAGMLKQIAVCSADLQWGLDLNNNIVVRTQEAPAWSIVSPGPVGTPVCFMTVSDDGQLFVVTSAGAAYLYHGADSSWQQVGDAEQKVKALSIRDVLNAWCITMDGLPLYIGESKSNAVIDVGLSKPILQWDTESVYDETKSTHLYIVNRAAQLAGTDPQLGAQILALLQPGAMPPAANIFRQKMCQGLYDADFLAPYNNPNWTGKPTWKSHFYDDSTGLNYVGEVQPTALTNGVLYFGRSVAFMSQAVPDVAQAGYNLGLALHYFTDLTQPMHASNYTYLSSFPFGYHTDFEVYMLEVQAGLLPQPTVTHFAFAGVEDVGVMYRQMSAHSKATYASQVLAAKNYMTWKLWPAQWKAAALEMFPAMLDDAVGHTSQLLYLWASLVPAVAQALVERVAAEETPAEAISA